MNLSFNGFQENKKKFVALPDQFFSELLPAIEDINELKLTIYILWSAYTQGDFATAFNQQDFLMDAKFVNGLNVEGAAAESVIAACLEKAVQRGSILRINPIEDGSQLVFFVNSPRGRQAAELLQQEWGARQTPVPKAGLESIQANVFQLYEENIGPLTPIIADALLEAQSSYPPEWLVEAIHLAVKNNVRRWKYIERILARWQEEGKDGAHRRDDQEDHRRYLKGEYGEIGKH